MRSTEHILTWTVHDDNDISKGNFDNINERFGIDVVNKAFNMRLNKKTKRIEYKKYREVNILMSGGTNSLTSTLANQSNVKFQGVSIGTFARNLIYKNIKEKYDYEDKGFYTDLENIREAYTIAKTLVEANVGEIYE